MNKTIGELILERQSRGETLIVVTLVKVKGSAPQEVGAKILVGKSGYIVGTIGGGKVEERVIEHALGMLESSDHFDYTEWNLQTDIKMTCGGVVSFFFERVVGKPDWEIAVFGAGHVAQELIRTLLKLECSITCIDPRAEWLAKLPDHHNLKKIQMDDMKEVVSSLSPKTFIVSVTMGHAFDLPIIQAVMESGNFPYIGAIGSASKALVLKSDLKKRGVSDERVQRLHCPIGEPFGNNTPVEIGLSIAAQLIKLRDAR